MGFSGGGSNILKSHTHNGLTVQDGGALDFNNITQSQSTAGMVFFSDGTHLQQLAYPGVPAGETLTAAAASSAPSWAAGAAGAWVNQGSDVSNAFVTSLSVDVGDADVYQILYHAADNGGLTNCCIRINDITTDSYKTLTSDGTPTSTNMDVNAGGFAATLDNKWLLSNQGGDAGYSGTVYIYKYNSNFNLGSEAGHTFTSEGSRQQGTGAPGTAQPYLISVNCGSAETITANITNIKLQMILEGSTTVGTIAGSMRVNSLSYS